MSSAVTTQVTDLQNYVNGAWRRSIATEYVEVSNPATTEVLARTPLSTSADVAAAVEAAADAFPAWRRTPPGERVQYLFKLKNLLEENLDELARVITIENGKTFAEAFANQQLAAWIAALSFVASNLLGPKRPTPAKEAPYECGIVPTREPGETAPPPLKPPHPRMVQNCVKLLPEQRIDRRDITVERRPAGFSLPRQAQSYGRAEPRG